jgi:hypothetical protein
MLNSLFSTSTTTTAVSLAALVGCIIAALALGLVLSMVYCFRTRHTRSFATTLALLPAIVCVVIAMVNGNIGAGVAVAGAFSLVRFRSVPGSGKDISFVFLAMCVGLVCGMGYVFYAVLVTAIIGGAYLLYQLYGSRGLASAKDRSLRITVPEDLDYVGAFDDLFEKYTTYHELVSVKTANMGSLFRLVYDIGIADPSAEKAFIDELRCRNGNLEISLSHQEVATDEL